MFDEFIKQLRWYDLVILVLAAGVGAGCVLLVITIAYRDYLRESQS